MHVLATSLLLLGLYTTTTCTDNATCNQAILGRMGSGVIHSPNYPFDYPHNSSCNYRISMNHISSGAKTICFKFYRFHLETSTPFCSFDYTRVSNVKYCGSGLWQYGVATGETESNIWYENFCWPVSGDHFDVIFSSDNSINSLGFYAEFTVHSGISARITSPVIITGEAPCASGQWTCFNRRCINVNATCDAKDDCGDGSDESYTHARCGEQNLLTCDFSAQGVLSDGLCGLSQEGGVWHRSNTQAPSLDGPKADHTDGVDGYYIYIEGTSSSSYLVSPELTLPGGSTYCLRFWYYLYGNVPAETTLRVFVNREQAYNVPEWSRTQEAAGPTSTWNQAQIPLTTTSSLQVLFGAEVENIASGVALDDISVLRGECNGQETACNFESNLCGWHSVNLLGGFLADLSWRRHNRLIDPVGPLHDRSSIDGSGSYLFLNGSLPAFPEPRGLFESPPVSAWPGVVRCFHFSYYMAGYNSDCCILRVYLLDSYGQLSTAIWSQNAARRGMWKEASIEIRADGPYQVVLEGMVDAHEKGEIALDSFYSHLGQCPEVEEEESALCTAGEYLCTDGTCIPSDHKCNGNVDCSDNSDEDWRAGCPTATTTPTPDEPCPPTHFYCADRSKCIPPTWVCDNFGDCVDQSDEDESTCGLSTTSTITAPTCRPEEFVCRNGNCIQLSQVCDGEDQCQDGSDEQTPNCTWAVALGCSSTEYPCVSSRQCIPASRLCDGVEDCPDGFDEALETAGCSQVAIQLMGISTSGAIGISLACLLVLVIIGIAIAMFNRRKRHQDHPHHRQNTSSATLASSADISTISYGINVAPRQFTMTQTAEEDEEEDEEGHIYETLVEPPDLIQPPPYSPRSSAYHSSAHAHTMNGRPPTPPPYNHRPPIVCLPPDDPPPPYDAVIKDIVVLNPTSQLWLHPSTSV